MVISLLQTYLSFFLKTESTLHSKKPIYCFEISTLKNWVLLLSKPSNSKFFPMKTKISSHKLNLESTTLFIQNYVLTYNTF